MTRQVTIRRLVRTILLLLTLSFWINLFILIEWSKLVENNNADVNRCNQKNLCRYRYPITREPKDYSSITAGPGWNTTAVGDDADSSVSRDFVTALMSAHQKSNSGKQNCFSLFTSDLEDAAVTSIAAVIATAVRMRRTCTILMPEVV